MSVIQTAGLIIALLPTFIRVIYTRIRMLRISEKNSAVVQRKEIRLRHIMMGISFMSVFITSLPMVCLRQMSPDENGKNTAVLNLLMLKIYDDEFIFLIFFLL